MCPKKNFNRNSTKEYLNLGSRVTGMENDKYEMFKYCMNFFCISFTIAAMS
jgi:predicted transport protein